MSTVYKTIGVKVSKQSKKSEWISIHTDQQSVTANSRRINELLIPNVVGMSIKDALYILENQGLEVKFFGKGVVKSQSISPGEKIVKGSVIALELV